MRNQDLIYGRKANRAAQEPPKPDTDPSAVTPAAPEA
jgi:hypothetical protein